MTQCKSISPQVLIPISLYVSIELVKLGQVFLLHNDLDLYDEETDLSIQCRALNITEDLGQIQYIFSDKTGTLTENKMVFRRCTIVGNEYCHQENGMRVHKWTGGQGHYPDPISPTHTHTEVLVAFWQVTLPFHIAKDVYIKDGLRLNVSQCVSVMKPGWEISSVTLPGMSEQI